MRRRYIFRYQSRYNNRFPIDEADSKCLRVFNVIMMMVMGFIVAGLLCFSLTLGGCSRSVYVPVEKGVELHDTIRVSTSYIERVRLDTINVYYELPAQSQMVAIHDTVSELETDLAVSRASFIGGILTHSLANRAGRMEIPAIVPQRSVTATNDSAAVREIPIPMPQPYPVPAQLTKWQSLRLSAFWPMLAGYALLIVLLLWRLRQK